MIIVSAILIAVAIMWDGEGGRLSSTRSDTWPEQENSPHSDFRMPYEEDHVRGNSSADVYIVEYSDFECPFCARLHPTLGRVVEEDEDVKWIYRHFPLSSHANAFDAAVASECVAKLGGNDAFWSFADRAFANQRSLGDRFYNNFIRSAGINADRFAECLSDEKVADDVQDDLDEVIAVGGRGTPFVVVISPEGKLTSFSGALPYERIKALVDSIKN